MRRRTILVALVALLVAGALAPAASAQALIPDVGKGAGASTEAAKLSSVPCGIGVAFVCAADTIVDTATDIAGDAVGAAGDAVMGGVVSWAADGAAWLVTRIGEQIDKSTRPAIGSAWFGAQYASVRELAIALAALFLIAAVAHAVVRQDLRMLAYSAFVALPLAMMLTFAAVTLVELGLALTDWMTAQALASFGRDSRSSLEQLAQLLQPSALTGSPLPGLVVFLSAALMAALSLVVWIELVLREASIYVAVSFLPISLMAMVWRPTASWARRLSEWLAAIVLAKFTIAAAFAVASSALAHSSAGGGLTALLAGCAVLLVAALTPWVLLRMLPGSTSAAHGMHRGVVRQAAGTATGATTASMVTRQVMLRSFTPAAAKPSAGSQLAAATTAPPPPPAPPPPSGGPQLDPPPRRQRAKVG